MKKDNIFVRMKNSIYNVQKIGIYAKYGVGKAILYALLLCTFLGLIQSVYMGIQINSGVNNIKSILDQEKYKFKIENSQLKLETSPIKEEESGMLFYANDKIKISEESKIKKIGVNSDFIILVLKDGIITKSNNPDILSNDTKFTYSDMLLKNVTNKELISMIEYGKFITIIIIMMIVIIQMFATYLFYALMITTLTMLNNVIYKLDLKYSEVYSLVIYAATLPNIIILVLGLVKPNEYLSTICIVGTLLYTILIMRDMKNNKLDKLNS